MQVQLPVQPRKYSEPSPKSPTEDENVSMLRRNKSFNADGKLAVPADQIPAAKKNRWRSKFDFFTTCAGFVVGLPSVWRFPNVCFQHGGGSFLVAYLIVAIILGIPMYQLELSIGQTMQTGFVRIWPTFSRRLTGVGLTAITLAFFCASYLSVIIAWACYYLYKCFVKWPPAWGHDLHSSSRFFLEDVLRKSPSVEHIRWSSTNYSVVIALGVVWLLAFLFAYKGSTRLTWFNIVATVLPLVVLYVAATLSIKLAGAATGLSYLFVPSLESLLSVRLWVDAAVQVFYSLGIGWGVLVNIASYSDRKNNFVSDSLIVFALGISSSIAAAISVFAVIGHLSRRYNEPFDAVMTGGSGLIFKSIPIAFLDLPGAVGRISTIIFFVLIICLGFASIATMFQLLLTSITDARLCFVKYPGAVKAILVSVFLILGSLPFALPNGVYLLETADEWAGSVTLVTVVVLELLAVTWYRPLDRYILEVQTETGIRLRNLFRVPIKFALPFLTIALVWGAVSDYGHQGIIRPRFGGSSVEEDVRHFGCFKSCSGHGLCHRGQYCVCEKGWSSLDCSIALQGEASDEFACPELCNDRGACDTSIGLCSCTPEYQGLACETPRYDHTKPIWLIVVASIWAFGSLLPGLLCYLFTPIQNFLAYKMEADEPQQIQKPWNGEPPGVPETPTAVP